MSSPATASSESSPVALTPSTIRPLDPSVINRIAAGEVVHRPAHAIKELIENAIDARATRIAVTLRDGGLKLLSVTDNGTGISRTDFPLVCQRFTTSKLQSYDDLSTLHSFGFRGEALASLTHIARVTIISMTRQSQCAYRASFADGAIVGDTEPRACAGVYGTTIIAEDLFHNVPLRRAALRNGSDEHAKCLDVLCRYAIHFSGVAFSCKKFGASVTDLNTQSSASVLDNIRAIHGSAVARELLPLTVNDRELGLLVDGYLSNANYSVKKFQCTVFINHRLVDFPALKRMARALYEPLLPKHSHPFLYLALTLPTQSIDVNIHPTKAEVHLLHEESIVALIERAMKLRLEHSNQSRVFATHSVSIDRNVSSMIASTHIHSDTGTTNGSGIDAENDNVNTPQPQSQSTLTNVAYDSIGRTASKKAARPNRMVRTDARQESIAAFVQRMSASDSAETETDLTQDSGEDYSDMPPLSQALSQQLPPPPPSQSQSRKRSRQPCSELTSVNELLQSLHSDSSASLTAILSDCSYVGTVDGRHSLIQHRTRLYYVNHTALSQSLFQYRLLMQFAAHPTLALSVPVDCHQLLSLAMPPHSMVTINERCQLLVSKRAMLAEYFSCHLTAQCQLIGLPDLIDRHQPRLERLPLLLHQLTDGVDWSDELRCFDQLTRAFAAFYRIEGEDEARGADVRSAVEFALIPAFKLGFAPPRSALVDGLVMQIAALENLYKIFERC